MTAGNGQYEIKESFYHLEISCRYIAEKFGAPNFTEWTNGDYIRLSSILSRATSVQISPNTLKRIFGKLKTPERYFPQRATRDALVQYAGYQNWESFLIAHPKPVKPPAAGPGNVSELPGPSLTEASIAAEAPASNEIDQSQKTADSIIESSKAETPETRQQHLPVDTAAPTSKSNRNGLRLMYLVAGIVMILVAGYLVSQKIARKPIEDLHLGISFSCKNPIGKNPHSAVFKLQLTDQFRGDESKFTIFFGDGRPEKQIRNGVVQTHYYEIPGRYYAQLRYDGNSIDTIPVFLQTDGWTATATVERDTMRVYPVIADSL
ncbi:MAG: hypothetical protein EOO01_41015, partial [Chitinophagaceae bacterium]